MDDLEVKREKGGGGGVLLVKCLGKCLVFVNSLSHVEYWLLRIKREKGGGEAESG